jgi:7-carboxy-7-deazaguanine synthase
MRAFEMVVNEIFHSIQGEGLLAGAPSVFIRLAGCPLRCIWCDTQYAWDTNEGDDIPVAEIVNKAVHWPCRYVVITGGEPMVNPELPDLVQALKERNKHITIETAGIKFVAGLACDLMSISPKLSNSVQSGEATPATQYLSSLKQLIRRYPYQFKFVVDSADDLPEIQQTLKQIGGVSAEKVMLMPQAKKRDELIAKSPMVAELCKETGFCFCQRLHILLYDGAKGK